MDKIKLNKIYDLLVSIGGASETERYSFVYDHEQGFCGEWRFCGFLGFGGKYHSEKNKVNCYSEDMTAERFNIIARLNKALAEIK